MSGPNVNTTNNENHDDTTSSSSSSETRSSSTTSQEVVKAPVQVRHVLHRPRSNVSADFDYRKRTVYKSDYKYRHYYCCNVFQGRYELHNRPYSCCEWFYGSPLWLLILMAVFLLILIVIFLILFGLQPTLNSSRYTETVEKRLINRTRIIYGFYQNCGYQVNSSYLLTTLILCSNTGTTTTGRIELSSFYTVISCGKSLFNGSTLLLIQLFHFLI